jgi:8-oxo-dGTP pyrophosphatase MutT (NUDIX family)
MIKEISYGSYIIPVRTHNGEKQFAKLKYPDGYGSIGGRFDEGETDAREVLRRELREELGTDAALLVDAAIQIPEHEISKVEPSSVEIRGAFNENHTLFIVKVPENTVLTFVEERPEKIEVVWLPLNALLDEQVTSRAEKREYYAKHVIPMIEKL